MPARLVRCGSVSSFTSSPSVYTHCSSCLRREFSSTTASQTRLRRQMFAWLNGPGQNFQHPLQRTTNYLSSYTQGGVDLRKTEQANPPGAASFNKDTTDSLALEEAAEDDATKDIQSRDFRPFPLNLHFYSESVLSEPLRNEIWKRVQVDKKSVRTVSVEMGVEMRRVGAVVRLVELERRIRKQGLPLALPYARAVHSMIPVTPFENGNIVTHEAINDILVHPLTTQQLFYPTSESRAFNRTDAGRIFSGAPRLPDDQDVGQGGKPARDPWQDTEVEYVGKGDNEIEVLKPTDARIPHPHLIAYEKDRRDPQFRNAEEEIKKRYAQRFIEDAEKREAARAKRMVKQEARKTRVDTDRWQFIVTDAKSTAKGTGKDGRGTGSVGFRYGVPHEDRKKAQVKIPTKVEV